MNNFRANELFKLKQCQKIYETGLAIPSQSADWQSAYKQNHYFTCGQMEEFITVKIRDFCCILDPLNDIISWNL